MERESAEFAESLLACGCNLQMRNQRNAKGIDKEKENNEHENKKIKTGTENKNGALIRKFNSYPLKKKKKLNTKQFM